MDSYQCVLRRFHAIFVTKNWSVTDPDPKLIIPDPDPANNFGSERHRIHNTAPLAKRFLHPGSACDMMQQISVTLNENLGGWFILACFFVETI